MAKLTTITKTPAQLVDEIGALKAAIAGPAAQLKQLEAQLKAFGPGAYQGALWDASISQSTRETLDMQAAREKLSPQFIAAHTSYTDVITLRVTARKLAIAA